MWYVLDVTYDDTLRPASRPPGLSEFVLILVLTRSSMDIDDMEQTPAPSEEVHLPDPENGHNDDEEEATLRASSKIVDTECDSSSRKSASE